MKKIMFNDLYGLTAAVLNEKKTMTRRIIPIDICNATDWKAFEEGDMKCYGTFEGDWVDIRRVATYQVGEVVAVAQSYESMANGGYIDQMIVPSDNPFGFEFKPEYCGAGYTNKMFVRAELMPNRIRITDINVERLQDISKEDCLKEGIDEDYTEYGDALYWVSVPHKGISWEEYKKRSYELARHEFNGKTGSYFWDTPQGAFAALIDKVSGKGTWDRNPWVFVYTFELINK